ncbi:DMT family transporter [Bacillus sp. CGMCC 1.16607]|uniref:DMT family transporter n=1 Tax=Bacillus sp. CGMCC 1.16607 TaxID=3351842 RepID=UPI003640F86D
MGKLYGSLLTLSLIWGTSFLFIKILLEELSPAAVVFGRCFFGTVTLIIIAFIRKDQILKKNLPWGFILLVALTNNVLPWFFISSGETSISSSLASILNATTPIWTLIIGFLFFGNVLKKNQWFGIFIGFMGIFLLSDFSLSDFNKSHMTGVMFMSAAAFCYGVASQMTKRYLVDLSIMQISFYTLFISSIISFFLMMITSPKSVTGFTNYENILLLLGLGALGSGVAYLLYYYMVTKGSPEFASFVTYLAPVSAIMWGALLLNEAIHSSMVIGLIIIFSGVFISSKRTRADKNTEKPAA